MPDEQLAAQTGRTKQAVFLQRRKRGIGPYRPPGPRWTREELALLGTASDEEIARRFGRTKAAVARKRSEMGIPNPFDRRRRDDKQ
jgi:hypothetical protein